LNSAITVFPLSGGPVRLTGIWWACMTVSLATPAYNACSGSSAAMVHKWEKKGNKWSGLNMHQEMHEELF